MFTQKHHDPQNPLAEVFEFDQVKEIQNEVTKILSRFLKPKDVTGVNNDLMELWWKLLEKYSDVLTRAVIESDSHLQDLQERAW